MLACFCTQSQTIEKPECDSEHAGTICCQVCGSAVPVSMLLRCADDRATTAARGMTPAQTPCSVSVRYATSCLVARHERCCRKLHACTAARKYNERNCMHDQFSGDVTTRLMFCLGPLVNVDVRLAKLWPNRHESHRLQAFRDPVTASQAVL